MDQYQTNTLIILQHIKLEIWRLMEKLQWLSLEEISREESIPIVKCVGKIKSVDSKGNYYSFMMSDGTYDAEVTLYEQQSQYLLLELPTRNECVIVVGNSYKRQLTGKNPITKIKLKLFKNISDVQFETICSKIEMIGKQRQKQQNNINLVVKTKKSLAKELKAVVQSVEIRSLILGCVYMTLQNNVDLSSYTFSLYTIQKHRLTKSYVESKKLREESVQYLAQFLDPQLKYLVQNKQIEEKDRLENQKIYIVHRATFKKYEMRILGIINERQKTGTTLSDLVNILNREQGFVEQKNYVLNDNFVQKMLKKFIEQSRIYKTSDKILYPNN